MKIDSKPLRYAHAEGHTDICYSEGGQHIITCGHDGDVRIWVDIEDDDPNSHCVGESAVAVCYKDKRLYVATDNHAVQAYTFPAFDKDGIVSRFTAPVTQIKTSPKIECGGGGQWTAMFSNIKGLDKLPHSRDALHQHLKRAYYQTFVCHTTEFVMQRVQRQVLGCSSENMEAKVCSPEGGAPIFVITDHNGPVLSIAICPQTKYASTASGDGYLRIWDIDTQKIVKEVNCVPKINTFFAAKVLCRMDFEPTEGKYFAYPNNREIILLEYATWAQRMVFTHSLIKCAISQCMFSPCGEYLAGSTVAGQIAVWEVQTGTCMGVIEHPTSHNVTSMAWNPKGNGVLAYCDMAGQLGMLVNCCGKNSRSLADDNDVEMVGRTEDDDDLVDNLIENYESDDDNAISLEKIKNETLRLNDKEDDASYRPATSQRGTPVPHTVPPQSPFQSSSTPVHLEHRYMCWNDVGIVRCHTQESGECSIDVEFHDTNIHHGIHLNQYTNYTMASLSSTVLALGCETPSKLVCISLVGNSKEWSVSMTDTEEILCVTCASGIVACATNARLLRLFTAMGTQRQVISLAGPVVSLAAYNTTVMAVYHGAETGVSDQHLAMDIIALNGRQVRCKTIPVPLTPGSKLNWLGSSDSGSPCSYDDSGMLRLYDVASGVWIPLCDTTVHSRGASDSWFIVSVSEPTQTVRSILCRGTTYPLTVPKPIVTELPIQIPLCELDTEKAQYEEQLVRWAHTSADVEVKNARETALKLFALACRSEIEQRALELMELLKDDRLLPLAAKYASRLGRLHLAEKLTDLADTWEKEADKLNVAQNSHFQELDTQETYDVSNAEDLNASLIIPQKVTEKKNENITPIKPAPIKPSTGGKRNPFKKQTEASKSAQSPLGLTRTLVQVHSPANANTDLNRNQDPITRREGETFMDWFARNKLHLEKHNPEMTPAELTRHCMKMFKDLQLLYGDVEKGTKKQNNENSIPSKNGDESNNKRKNEKETTGGISTNAQKKSKLSGFAFQKKSVPT